MEAKRIGLCVNGKMQYRVFNKPIKLAPEQSFTLKIPTREVVNEHGAHVEYEPDLSAATIEAGPPIVDASGVDASAECRLDRLLSANIDMTKKRSLR